MHVHKNKGDKNNFQAFGTSLYEPFALIFEAFKLPGTTSAAPFS